VAPSRGHRRKGKLQQQKYILVIILILSAFKSKNLTKFKNEFIIRFTLKYILTFLHIRRLNVNPIIMDKPMNVRMNFNVGRYIVM